MPTITRGLAQNPPEIPAGKDKTRIFDDKLTGFIMEVRRSGKVTFYIRYNDVRGLQREIRVGRFGQVTVEQARRRAQELRAEAECGGDPARQRDKLRSLPSFAQFIESRYLPYAKERLRSYADHEGFYRLRLKGLWGHRRVDDIGPQDIVALQASLRSEKLTNATINRYTAFVRRVFNLALKWEIFEGKNPAQHAEMEPEQNRERFLTQEELRALFQALNKEPNRSAASAIALLAATGARRGEALGAQWEHMDFDRRLWRVPRAKSGKQRFIPLNDAALSILASQRPLATGPWVFPGADPNRPLYDFKKAWARVCKEASLPEGTRIHDLRHTFASSLVSKGCTIYEVSTLLGHSNVNMTARYAHLAPQRLIEAANNALPGIQGP